MEGIAGRVNGSKPQHRQMGRACENSASRAILRSLWLRTPLLMTFGLSGGSRELLGKVLQSAESGASTAGDLPGPDYLPPAGAAGPGLAAGLAQWLEPDWRILHDPEDASPADNSAPWDCVVNGGTCHYREQMGRLCRARNLLRDGGRLIVAGEFLRDVETIRKSDLPTEFSLLQLSSRLGFQLIDQVDWTDKARQSIAEARQILAPETARYRFPPAAWLQSLLRGMRTGRKPASTDAMGDLARELAALAADFESGHRRFECFVFELDAASGGAWSELELGDMSSFEPEEVAGIFRESFQAEFDPALWRWKYGEGKGTAIVARQEPGGPVIAHYGGVAREIDYFGRDRFAFQGCDVMVKPAVRRQYGRNSLYFHLTATLFEREIGYTVKHVLGFGFPNKPVMKTAMRLGLYGKVDDYVELAIPGNETSSAGWQIEPLVPERPAHQKAADDLWRAMRRDFRQGVIGKRHGAYLNWRYASHPHGANYFPLLLRRAGKARAIAVLKRHEEQWLLMDLVAPLASMDQAAGATRNWVDARPEPGALVMWLTAAWVRRLGWQGRIVKDLGIEIPFNAWNPGPDAELPAGAWWLTAGDMDFL